MRTLSFYRRAALFGFAGLLATRAESHAQLFTPGDLVVSTYGSANATLADGAATTISLLEFAPTGGAPLLNYTLPTADGVGGSANVGVVGEYGSSSEGNIQLSGDGRYLTLAGYSAADAAAGIGPTTNTANGTSFPTGTAYSKSTVALAQATSTDVLRVAVLIDGNGNTNSSTVFNNIYSTNNSRAVYSANGSSVYISGQGDKTTSQQGVFLAPTGLNTRNGGAPTGIYNAYDTRFVTGYNGNLYYSLDKKGSPTGIFQLGGQPTGAATGTQITMAGNGQTGTGKVSYSPEGFFFANATTLYVADTGVPKAGGTGAGGIQKWTLNNNVWTLQYTLANPSNFVAPTAAATATSGETGFEAITGQILAGGAIRLYAVSYTAGDANPNGLYAITDLLSSTTGVGETYTELASAAGNGGQVFKGVSFAPTAAVPEPSTWTLAGLGLAACAWLKRRRAARCA